jgi:hypothetical protein
MSDPCFLNLVDTLHDYLEALGNGCLTAFLGNWPPKPFRTRTVSRRLLPVVSVLPEIEVDAGDPSSEVLKTLKQCATQLRWGQTYTAEDVGDAFLRQYGWTECIGLRGPVASRAIACGFLLLGPETEYPRHRHEAEEIYVPFGSRALWSKGEEDWTLRQSGVPIYHEPWIAHGIRTGSAPLLALYIWHGKLLDQKSHITS